ncbi:39S ribosomal protein L50, mitochondrial [Apis laboriosa]|uniref:39S ribosomal protein L50, mitochondrial n=1 Tax=Apis laboriosa TaxID=183418 RepID=UPI001CC6730E|nr:39S ribosomal protein L50, mitochondrial [Apis laboriosa]
MAALIRHGFNSLKSSSTFLAVNTTSLRYDITRFKSKKRPEVKTSRFEDEKTSLSCKGFLRYQKKYNPPEDVCDRINKICETQQISTVDETKIEDPLQRFNLFLACEEELQHPITNAVLCYIETIGDLKNYYKTPIGNVTPLDAMRSMDLPKNLHINYEYIRFHPDTDTLFNGQTAFPKSSTLVTGLKYKKKYPGHYQDNPFLDNMLKV